MIEAVTDEGRGWLEGQFSGRRGAFPADRLLTAAQREAEKAAARAAQRPLVEELFAMFDADADGKLCKDEYEAYLRGIGFWGTGACTDDHYEEAGWPGQCEDMESGTEGIGWEAFEGILYGKYRLGKAQADLESCKRAGGGA